MKKKFIILCSVILLFNELPHRKVCSYPANNPDLSWSDLEYRDLTYNQNIKTVNLYTDRNIKSKIGPAVISIDGTDQLILEFDEL